MKIFTDSACDLPKAYFTEHDVHLFPLRVEISGQEFDDVVGIEPIEIYNQIRNGNRPKTSQVSPEAFLTAFTELAKSGEQGLYIAFSSNLSGTYSTAMMLREQVREEYPDLQLEIIDTKCASLGMGLVVEEAVRLRDENFSYEEVINRTRFQAEHMEHLFTVEDLDFLAKGGRVSKSSAFIGGLLNIKPLMHMEDGKLVPIEKIRGRKKVFKRIIEVMAERGENLSDQVIGISHGDDMDAANEMKRMIVDAFHPKAVQIEIVGSTIASHTGPSVIAIFFLNRQFNA
ncbi:DegV family protein [Kurthia sp. Dielmo]|uniref:DegV family protein n=1 Tax=Kurthia sp. Dielmo TaxID=1033738 RepID=UPI0002F08074|nr:DegV family protein [Kurthia sp. Dielmo]